MGDAMQQAKTEAHAIALEQKLDTIQTDDLVASRQLEASWAGYLGKAIAIAAFILGAGVGIARSSPIPALAGVVFALFMVYVPTIIDTIMTATI